MKKYFTVLFSIFLSLIVILMASFGGSDLKNSGGAPPGYTNSPGDGLNCSHCMGGTPVAVTGWITSNIPVTGYVPGATYTISVTATGSGNKGFEVSPQDISGTLIGTLTAGTGNKLVGGGKYVTHSSAQSGNPATWNFQWTAPASGAGSVTFYGSFAVGKPNTKTTTMTVSQSTVGIAAKEKPVMQISPNPGRGFTTICFLLDSPQSIRIELFNVKGERIRVLLDEPFSAGEYKRTFTLDQVPGIYFIRLNTGETECLSKLILTD
jgi:hypothetical protein